MSRLTRITAKNHRRTGEPIVAVEMGDAQTGIAEFRFRLSSLRGDEGSGDPASFALEGMALAGGLAMDGDRLTEWMRARPAVSDDLRRTLRERMLCAAPRRGAPGEIRTWREDDLIGVRISPEGNWPHQASIAVFDVSDCAQGFYDEPDPETGYGGGWDIDFAIDGAYWVEALEDGDVVPQSAFVRLSAKDERWVENAIIADHYDYIWERMERARIEGEEEARYGHNETPGTDDA